MPWTDTVIVSFCLPGVIVTLPPACGRQAWMPADGTSLNVKDFDCELETAALAPADIAIVPARPRALVAAAIRVRARLRGKWYFMIGNLLSRWRPMLAPPVLVFPGPGMSGRSTDARPGRVQPLPRKLRGHPP